MSKRTLLLGGALVLALLTAGLLCAYQPKPPDLPAGIAAANWVPLGENLGVSLSTGRMYLAQHAIPKTLPYNTLHGTLYVKVANIWQRLYFEPAPITFVPTQ